MASETNSEHSLLVEHDVRERRKTRGQSLLAMGAFGAGILATVVVALVVTTGTRGSAPTTSGDQYAMEVVKQKGPKVPKPGDKDSIFPKLGDKDASKRSSKTATEAPTSTTTPKCGRFGEVVSYFLADGDYPEYIYDSDDAEYCDWFSDEPFTIQLLINTDGTGFMSLADGYDQGENDAEAECLATGWILSPAIISSGALFPNEEVNATCWYNPAGVGRYLFEMRPAMQKCYNEMSGYYGGTGANKIDHMLFSLTVNPNGPDKGSILYRQSGGTWTYEDNDCFMVLNAANLKAFNPHFGESWSTAYPIQCFDSCTDVRSGLGWSKP